MYVNAERAIGGAPSAEREDGPASGGVAPRLLERFRAVRARSTALAAPLSAEDQVTQSMPDCSPTKWHLAHTTWFFETMVLAETAGYAVFDPAFNYLFNSYYEALGPRQPRAARGLLTRPSVDEVAGYRRHVDASMIDRLGSDSLSHELLARVVLGLAHEEQHQELLLTDVQHLLAQNPLRPAYQVESIASAGERGGAGVAAKRPAWVSFEGGLVETGAVIGDGLSAPFAFDNEGPPHRTWLEPFSLADRLATNAEWLEFIDDGGYTRPEFWLSDGWATVQAESWRAPLYWEQDGTGAWSVFGLSGKRSVDPSAPVQHVSLYEADAFARWSSARLPTEAEWEYATLTRADGLDGLFGQVWQWTGSAYSPYPGFQPGAGALGEYNGKFMVNQAVLRGSSWATSPGHSRPSYRNFFAPHARWQVTGVRLAVDGRSNEMGRSTA